MQRGISPDAVGSMSLGSGFRMVGAAGGFDPFHQGHLLHLLGAAELGDYLIVFVSTDEDMIQKKGKCNIPLAFRVMTVKSVLQHFNIKGTVVPTMDTDGTQAKTLAWYRPSIFAKGGDRDGGNMPQNELDVCIEKGIEIIYGVGDQLNRASQMKI